jgi:hypothetical protein
VLFGILYMTIMPIEKEFEAHHYLQITTNISSFLFSTEELLVFGNIHQTLFC